METESPTQSSDRALEILLRKLEEARSRNSLVSLRAFAQRLGMSSGALSEVLSGKRPLSNPVKRRIAAKLLLSPQEMVEFFGNDVPEKLGLASDERLTLSQDQFRMISEWWYFGLLNLLKTRGFRSNVNWMAKRLGLSSHVVADAWERLFRLGYLEVRKTSGKTEVVRLQPNVKTTDNLLDLSIRKAHLEDLKLIENTIREVPMELHDNTSCTMVINKEDMPKVRELIRIFQSQFMNQIGKDTGDEVYKLSMAFYPLTKVAEAGMKQGAKNQ